MGSSNSKELESLKSENAKLRGEITQFRQRLDQLQKTLSQDRNLYENVRNWIVAWRASRPAGIHFRDVTAIIGSKGSGKSTYLWMKMPGFPKPEITYGNGTNSVNLYPTAGFMDTIGINYEINCMARLLALFLIKGVPRTAIFSSNDRIDRVVAILNHLSITKYYILALDVKYLHRYYRSSSRYFFNPDIDQAFDVGAYDAWERRNRNCIRCDARNPERFEVLETFQDALKLLFPSNVIGLADYNEFMDPTQEGQKSARVLAYLVCKELKAFYETYGENEVAFMDQI